MQLKKRIERLETEKSEENAHPQAVLERVRHEVYESTREDFWALDGFCLEYQCMRSDCLDFDATRSLVEKQLALRERLRSLERSEQRRIAELEGFRMTFAPGGWTSPVRTRAGKDRPYGNT